MRPAKLCTSGSTRRIWSKFGHLCGYHFVVDARLLAHRRLWGIGILSLCCLLVSCQHDPWADQFVRTKLADGDLVGTYRVDSDTLGRRISIPICTKTLSISQDAEIVLSADHKAQFLQVPGVHEPATQTCVVNGAGSWELGRNDAYSVVNVKIQLKDNRRSDECQPTYYGQLMIYGRKPPYKLHIAIGDPDSGEAMQFERAK